MPWTDALYPWLLHSAIISLLVLSVGCGAVLLCRQPVRRVRMIELTLAGCLVAPWLGTIPGYPRVPVASRAAADPGPRETRLAPSEERMAVPIDAPGDDPPIPSQVLPPGPAAEIADEPPHAFDSARWIVAAYGIGVALGLGWWLVGLLGLARILRTSRPAPPRCQ